MRDLICLPPDYSQVEWNPSDLDRMQRMLDAELHESWGRRLRYHLAYRLFGSRPVMILPDERRHEDVLREMTPRQRKQWERQVGNWRKWLGRRLAPKQPPCCAAYNLLYSNRIVPALARDETAVAVLRFEENVPRLLLDGEELTDPVLIREWRLFRYRYADIPVNCEAESGRVYSYEISTCGPGTGGRKFTVEVTFRREGNTEELSFSSEAAE